MAELDRLTKFPPVARLFVAWFTTLVLAVCVWVVWDYVQEHRLADQETYDDAADYGPAVEAEIEDIASDSSAVRAPIWDTIHAGQDTPFDTSEVDTMERRAGLADDGMVDMAAVVPAEDRLGHNLGIARIHFQGETLLFFALGAVFLFTSVSARFKRIILWLLGVAILVNMIGISGSGFYSLFDFIEMLSGVVLLLLVLYICIVIYRDLGRKRTE